MKCAICKEGETVEINFLSLTLKIIKMKRKRKKQNYTTTKRFYKLMAAMLLIMWLGVLNTTIAQEANARQDQNVLFNFVADNKLKQINLFLK